MFGAPVQATDTVPWRESTDMVQFPTKAGERSIDPLTWEVDRQVVTAQVQSVLLAFRSNAKFSSTARFFNTARHSEHPLVHTMLELQKHLLHCKSPSWVASISQGISDDGNRNKGAVAEEAMPGCAPSAKHTSTPPSARCVTPPSSSRLVRERGLSKILDGHADWSLPEEDILNPFCAVCKSPETSETITTVALSAIVAMLERPCAFITEAGFHAVIQAAAAARCEITDSPTHEVLLARILNVYVACTRHTLALKLSEKIFLSMIRHMLVIALRSGTSPLLRCTAENAMKSLVTFLYEHVSLGDDMGDEAAVFPTSQYADGAEMMKFISGLIRGDITSLDADGNPVTDAMDDSSVNGKPRNRRATVKNSAVALQLEGLWLAQYALLAIKQRQRGLSQGRLLTAIQNHLSRALLTAGVGEANVVVYSQVLRTVHLVVKCATVLVVPQVHHFLRVLLLNPLDELSGKLAHYSGMTSPSSPSLSVPSSSRGQPVSGHTFHRNDVLALSSSQIVELHERREMLLESLTEFFSDPYFATFCYANYDLSWRHISVFPLLCDVLCGTVCDAENAINEGGTEQVSTTTWTNCENSGTPSRAFNHTQLIALNATLNFVSQIVESHPDGGPPSGGRYHWEETTNAFVEHNLRQKTLLSRFAALFADSPIRKGIPFLLENGVRVEKGDEISAAQRYGTQLIVSEPAGGWEIGECLHRLSTVLDKRVLGDHIGDLGKELTPEPGIAESETAVDGTLSAHQVWELSRSGDHLILGTVRFFNEQLKGFMSLYNFTGKSLLTSIREMVYQLHLPGESQKIDRIMEEFANHWYSQNTDQPATINPFRTQACAFVLSFAIIMLNTDLHSGKMHTKMTLEGFKRMNRGIDDGNDVPGAYLEAVYNNVEQHELIVAEMMDRDFANDVTWRLGMEGASLDGRDNVEEQLLDLVSCDSDRPSKQVSQESSETASTVHRVPSALLSSTTCSETLFVQRRIRLKRVLSKYVLSSVWKRCLLLFTAILSVSGQHLARITVRGSNVNEVLEQAHRASSTALVAFTSSLRGVAMLTQAAAAMGLPDIADHCLLTLLSFVSRELRCISNEGALNVCRSLPVLLSVKEVFTLLPPLAPCLRDSWPAVALCLRNLYFLGLTVVKGPSSLPDPLTKTAGIQSDILRLNGQPPAAEGGGWFSGLWGGGGDHHQTTAQAAMKTELQERLGMGYIQLFVPDMNDVLALLGSMSASSRVALVQAMCGLSCSSLDSVTEGWQISFQTWLLAALVAAEPESGTCALFCGFYQKHIRPVFEDIVKHGHFPFTAGQHMGLSVTWEEYGRAELSLTPVDIAMVPRMVEAVVWLTGELSRHDARLMHEVAGLLIQMPEVVFDLVAMKPLADVMSRLCAQCATPSHTSSLSHHFLVELAVLYSSRIHALTDPSVVYVLYCVLQYIMQCESFHTHHTMESTVSVAVAIGMWILSRPTSESARLSAVAAMQPPPRSCDAASQADTSSFNGMNSLTIGNIIDILCSCSRRVVRWGPELLQAGEESTWYRLWTLPLGGLCAFVMYEVSSRDGSEALLSLQRCLLDTELCGIPATTILRIYDDALFPLTERTCAPGAAVPAVVSNALPSVKQANEQPSAVNMRQTPLKSVVLALFGPFAPPPAASTPSTAADTSDGRLHCTNRRYVAAETKCRVINLLPKLLLQYVNTFGESPSLLQELWQRILGTLYALFDAYKATNVPVSSGEDAAMVYEAVEETVKNMVYVAATALSEPTQMEAVQAAAPYFWISTRNLIRPFDFSSPLLTFLDSVVMQPDP